MQPQRHRDTEAAEKKECEDHFSLSSTCPLAPDTWNDLRAVELFSPPEDTGDFIQFPLVEGSRVVTVFSADRQNGTASGVAIGGTGSSDTILAAWLRNSLRSMNITWRRCSLSKCWPSQLRA